MPSTVVVRGSGGAIFEMDVPASGFALAHWQERLDKGDIVIIDDSPAKDAKPAPVKRAAKKADAAKAEATTDDEG
jgi:hypothetical protein